MIGPGLFDFDLGDAEIETFTKSREPSLLTSITLSGFRSRCTMPAA